MLKTLVLLYKNAEFLQFCLQDAVHKEIIPDQKTACEVYDPDIQYGE